MTELEISREEWNQVVEIIPTIWRPGSLDQKGQSENPNTSRVTRFISVCDSLDHFRPRIEKKATEDEVIERLHRRQGKLQRILCHPCNWLQIPQPYILKEISLLLAFTKTPFDDDDHKCFQILLTIYKQLTGDVVDCPRYGSHWEQIGFQGTDPSTDLRGVGLLGLLQPLFLLTHSEFVPFGHKVFSLSKKEGQDFPFMVLSINLTRIVLDALMDGLLKSVCYKVGFWYHFNFFYCSVLFQYFHIWRGQNKTIMDSGYVLKDVEKIARTKQLRTIEQFKTHLMSYSEEEKQYAESNIAKRLKEQDL